MPNMMVLGDRAFGTWLGHDGILIKGISALTGEAWESPIALSTMWRHKKYEVYVPGESLHLTTRAL